MLNKTDQMRKHKRSLLNPYRISNIQTIDNHVKSMRFGNEFLESFHFGRSGFVEDILADDDVLEQLLLQIGELFVCWLKDFQPGAAGLTNTSENIVNNRAYSDAARITTF